MRVISGSAKGTKLSSIEENSTRPTLDRVKEAMFNIVQTKIEDADVLDLFAGSGAIGIEFLSRGCKQAYFCDLSRKAINMIHQNLKKTRLEENAIVINKDYKKCLEMLHKQERVFDIIFIDPPYKDNVAVNSVELILSLKLLKENGIIIIETDEQDREIDNLKKLDVQVYDSRKYGRVNLIFLIERG
ncbi:MAG: 16S rRNA (guanine(966)-N(2))-methyltransferase RsmD [Clostridiales bacterium]|nr:16S rRNA (guanine(966)-N(2))-methyltransferase RsmD [Clostridiales bacterium]